MDVSERRRRKHRGEEKVIYYIHGGECRMRCLRWRHNVLKKLNAPVLGAYYLGTAATHRLITIAISKVCDARVFGESLDHLTRVADTFG
jgi:hypothetical protein